MPADQKLLTLLSDVLDAARRAGADAADAVVFEATSMSVAQRLGQPEKLERSESRDLGLRAFVGRRQAIASSTDFGKPALDELVERVVAMARVAPEDKYCGLAERGQLAKEIKDLDIFDPSEPTAEKMIEMARQAEDAARAVPGVTNSEGAEVGFSSSAIALAATNGFANGYAMSSHSLSASVLAGESTAMERDYDFDSRVYGADLRAPADIGRSAGERAVRRLNARKVSSAQVPIVYDPRVSGGLVRHLAGAVNGAAIARGTSFLKSAMGQRIFPEGTRILDDPHRRRGLRSKPFDGEGIATTPMAVVDDGVLQTWILDLATARQLGLQTTGNAARGTSSTPSPAVSNLYLERGKISRDDMVRDIKRGLYVTELIGMGINGITGDYSRGAAGFWIEKGELVYPVSELTIAGNLKSMFQNLTVADDLEFRFGIDAPTVRVDGMTVAGT